MVLFMVCVVLWLVLGFMKMLIFGFIDICFEIGCMFFSVERLVKGSVSVIEIISMFNRKLFGECSRWCRVFVMVVKCCWS